MRALEGSLASTVELNKSLEAKLSASENSLADARAESAKLALEAQELRAALAERDEQLAQLKVQLDQALLESKAESEKSRSRLMALLTAGQEVVGKLGTAVLSAHDASAKPRPLEEIITPVATGAPPPEAHALSKAIGLLSPPLHGGRRGAEVGGAAAHQLPGGIRCVRQPVATVAPPPPPHAAPRRRLGSGSGRGSRYGRGSGSRYRRGSVPLEVLLGAAGIPSRSPSSRSRPRCSSCSGRRWATCAMRSRPREAEEEEEEAEEEEAPRPQQALRR